MCCMYIVESSQEHFAALINSWFREGQWVHNVRHVSHKYMYGGGRG